MLRKKLKVEAGKTYTVRDAVSTYTIIVGDIGESDSAPASTASDSSFAVGVGAPSLNLGRSGGVYLDSVSRKIYTKDAAGWDSGFDMGSSSSGLNGSNGRTTLEGSGPTTDSVVYAAALSDAGITASDVQNGDLYLDTLNHVFYKRVSDAWVSRSSHKGKNGRTIFEGSGDPDDPTSELPSDIADATAGDLYHDVVNFKWHHRNSSGIPGSRWDARSVYLGSIGPIGPDGLNGSNGLAGLDGKDGKTTLEGNGPPSDSVVYAAALADAGIESSEVKNGDLYLDTLNHVFYKMTSDVWVSRTSHVGRNGKTIFDGSGDPDDPTSEVPSDISDAAAGDLYHDVTNFKWYKRNSSGIPGDRWDPRNSYKPGELKNISLATSFNLATAASSGWLTNSALAAVKENDTVLDPNNKRMYKRTSTGWEDQGSIAGGKGDKGDAGESSLIGQLTKEVAVIPANSSGTVTNANLSALGGGYFKVYNGKTDVTSASTFVISSATAELAGSDYIDYVDNLQLNLVKATGQFSLSGETWSADSTSFALQATYGGSTVTKIYNVTKSKTGPGIRVYSVALGADSATSDIQLTASYRDMYLADVITNEGNILTATASKSATTFTINESGRYKIELQAAFRIKNVTRGTTYSAICSAQIVKGITSPSVTWTGSTSTLQATLASAVSASALAAYSSSTVTISKTAFLASGTTLKVQAKTSNVSGGASYLELADDTEVQSAEDTILTITKL